MGKKEITEANFEDEEGGRGIIGYNFMHFAPNKYFLLMLNSMNYLLNLAFPLTLLASLLGRDYYTVNKKYFSMSLL